MYCLLPRIGGAAAYGGAAGRGGPNGMDGGAAPEYNGGVGSADYRGQQQGAHTGNYCSIFYI